MPKSQNRREFLQNIGTLSIAAGTGSALSFLPHKITADNPSVYVREGKTLKIFNGQVITPYRTIKNGTIIAVDGIIIEVREGNLDVPGAEEIDAKGRYVAPGFVDLHVHGGGDHDFLDGDVNAFLRAAETHARHGTTSMYPTALSGDVDTLLENLDIYEEANRQNDYGAQFQGIFLEGPYYSMDQRGAQDPRYIRDPDPEEYKEILSHSPAIKRWDSAPERDGALEFARYLVSQGVLPSMGHTSAVYEEVLTGFENGYTLATHLYSGMLGVTRRDAYRYAGGVESAFLIDEMSVEIIADGKHLPASLLKLIYKIKGPDRITLVTDAMRGAGMPEGDSILGPRDAGLEVIIEEGVAKLPDRTSFAGSVATTDRLVRTMVNKADVPLIEAVRMMTATPASIMNINDKKGSLIAGKDADIVIFDSDILVEKTIIGGKVLYSR
jgi:N-acetylglucosamine-6-phosphate deacetylase